MEHVLAIAENMRKADVDEVSASTGEAVLPALRRSYKASVKCWTAVNQDRPVVIFGVAPFSILTGKGCPWMLATDEIEDIAIPFIRQSRRYVDEMQRSFPVLINRVDARNEVSIKWLKWLGFDVQPAVNSGLNGEPFHPFERRVNQCATQA